MFKQPWEKKHDLQTQQEQDKHLYNLRFLEQGNRIAALEGRISKLEALMGDEKPQRPFKTMWGDRLPQSSAPID